MDQRRNLRRGKLGRKQGHVVNSACKAIHSGLNLPDCELRWSRQTACWACGRGFQIAIHEDLHQTGRRIARGDDEVISAVVDRGRGLNRQIIAESSGAERKLAVQLRCPEVSGLTGHLTIDNASALPPICSHRRGLSRVDPCRDREVIGDGPRDRHKVIHTVKAHRRAQETGDSRRAQCGAVGVAACSCRTKRIGRDRPGCLVERVIRDGGQCQRLGLEILGSGNHRADGTGMQIGDRRRNVDDGEGSLSRDEAAVAVVDGEMQRVIPFVAYQRAAVEHGRSELRPIGSGDPTVEMAWPAIRRCRAASFVQRQPHHQFRSGRSRPDPLNLILLHQRDFGGTQDSPEDREIAERADERLRRIEPAADAVLVLTEEHAAVGDAQRPVVDFLSEQGARALRRAIQNQHGPPPS